MYSTKDIESLILSKEDFVISEASNICKLVKKGNFTLPTGKITNFQTIQYLLEKGTIECVTNLLVDEIQTLPSEVVSEPTLPKQGVLPEFTDPSLSATSSTVSPYTEGFYHFQAGDVINLNALVTFNPGEITEPWNNDAKQADRSGAITVARLSKSQAGISLNNGGTPFDVNDTLSLSIGGDFSISEFDFSDYEVDYGKQRWDVVITTSDGPIPKDSEGNNLPNLQLKGTTYSRTLWFNMIIYGSAPLFYGNNLANKEITGMFSNSVFQGNSPNANYFNLGFTAEDVDGRITFEIPNLHISQYGTPKFINQTSAVDITNLFTKVENNIPRTLSNGAEITYSRYQTTASLLTASQTITISFN